MADKLAKNVSMVQVACLVVILTATPIPAFGAWSTPEPIARLLGEASTEQLVALTMQYAAQLEQVPQSDPSPSLPVLINGTTYYFSALFERSPVDLPPAEPERVLYVDEILSQIRTNIANAEDPAKVQLDALRVIYPSSEEDWSLLADASEAVSIERYFRQELIRVLLPPSLRESQIPFSARMSMISLLLHNYKKDQQLAPKEHPLELKIIMEESRSLLPSALESFRRELNALSCELQLL